MNEAKNIVLLPHNEIGCSKLKESLKENQMVSINHATGTGKSFILLKYLYENRDKKILYMAPTYPIINQLFEEHMEELGISKKEFKTFDSMIYSNLLKKSDAEIREMAKYYDIVVLDEYHRCGAPLWGKKIKILLDAIKEYKEKKVIGTTATEIRYLDNERNMNDILFEGKEASRLTLSDAILQGILPAPIYVNYNIELLEDLRLIEKNINKYTFYKSDKNRYLSNLQKTKNAVNSTLNYKEALKDYLNICNKYLVFSSTIYNIDENRREIKNNHITSNHVLKDPSLIVNDKEIVEKIIGKPKRSYCVHSRLGKKQNDEALKKFRYDEEKSVLYSINILNEGVHVKGVDAVIMLRKTTSPIIYFQQLGRLLSYSRRNDNVVVLDLVNNIKNHKAIYQLYQDVVEKAKEYIEKDPKNKEKYENIIKKFKIVDMTSKLCEELDELKESFSKASILEKRLNTALNILEDEYYPNEIEKIQAKIDIIKYEKHITLDIYDRLKKIKLDNYPSVMSISRDEFIKELDGNKTIYRKERNRIKQLYKDIQEFYDYNDRMPSIFSEDENERELARNIIRNYNTFSIAMMSFIKESITEDMSLFEKISYGIQIQDIDYNELFKEAVYASKNNILINQYVFYSLYNKVDNEKLMELTFEDKDDDDFEDLDDKKKTNSINKNFMFTKQFEKVSESLIDCYEEPKLTECVNKLFEDIMNFMKTNNRELDFYDSELDGKELYQERELFCKKVLLHNELEKRGYLKIIEEYSLDFALNRKNITNERIIDKIIKFIVNNDGALPSVRNKDNIEEVKLARIYYENYDNLTDFQKEKIKEIIKENEYKKLEALNEYIEFININHRKPVFKGNKDEEELNKRLNRWIPFLTEEEKERLNNSNHSISKYNNLRNTYYMLQKKKFGK